MVMTCKAGLNVQPAVPQSLCFGLTELYMQHTPHGAAPDTVLLLLLLLLLLLCVAGRAAGGRAVSTCRRRR